MQKSDVAAGLAMVCILFFIFASLMHESKMDKRCSASGGVYIDSHCLAVAEINIER